MPVNLSIKNVPDDLAQKLRDRAAAHGRSLQRELLALLKASTRESSESYRPRPSSSAGRFGVKTLHEAIQALMPQGSPSSVDFIRAQRDAGLSVTLDQNPPSPRVG